MKNRTVILAGVAVLISVTILGMVWGLSSLAAGVPSNATAYLGFFALLVLFAGIIIVAGTAIEKAGRRPQDAATETASPKDYTPGERAVQTTVQGQDHEVVCGAWRDARGYRYVVRCLDQLPGLAVKTANSRAEESNYNGALQSPPTATR